MTFSKLAIKKLAEKCGFRITRLGHAAATTCASSHSRRWKLMDSCQIDTVIDAGANTGQYVLMLRASGYSGTVISFEPQNAAYEELRVIANSDPKWFTHQMALGDTDGELEMNISRQSMSSSLLAMQEGHLKAYPGSNYIGVQQTKVARLDTALERVRRDAKLMLKMDVQGYEMALLRGATEILKSVRIVEAEVCLQELYEGQPTAGELFQFLERAGYSLAMFTEGDINPDGRAIWGDALFIRG